jgi:hypothetical protein
MDKKHKKHKKYKDINFMNVYLNVVHIEEFFDRLASAKNIKEFEKIAKQLERSSDCAPVDLEYITSADDTSLRISIGMAGYKFDRIGIMIAFTYLCSYSKNNGYVEDKRNYLFQVDRKLYNLEDGYSAVMNKLNN